MVRHLWRDGVRVGRDRARRQMRLMGLQAIVQAPRSTTRYPGAEALTEALERYGQPQIFNTDQGSRFTSFEFTATLKDAGVAISMDGRGRCMDNIFIERLWRSQVRGRLPARALRWLPGPTGHRPMNGSLQHPKTPLRPRRRHPDRGLRQRNADRDTGGAPHSPTPLPAQPEHEDVLNRSLAA